MSRIRFDRTKLLLALFVTAGLSGLVSPGLASAADYKVDVLKEAAAGDGVAKEVQDRLADSGLRVSEGTSPYCDLWLCKDWPVKADFKLTNEIQFPFQPGELIGLARYHKKGNDFRGQDIKPGVYTVRYALQPVDGNHVGTSDTRDFLLLSKVTDDTSAKVMDEKALFKQSAKAVGSTHPAMLCLRKPAQDNVPGIAHDEEAERWSVRFAGTPQGGKPGSLALELIVVGMVKE